MKITENLIKYKVIIGVFLLLIVPFIVVPGMYFPYITGKAFYFRVIVELIFSIWLCGALFYKNLRPAKSSLLYAITGFVVVSFIADLFGSNFQNSFWSNFERMEGFITLIHLFALFLVTTSVFKSKKLWDGLFKTSLVFSLILSLHALSQFADARAAGESIRVASFLGNPIYLAEFLLMHIFIAFLYIRDAGKSMKFYYGFTIIFNGIVLFMTATRGAALGLVAGIFVMIVLGSLFIREKEDRNYRKISSISLIVLCLLGGMFWLSRKADFIQESPILSRFANISITEKTAVGRLTNWGIAWEGFKEQPILGYGQSNYNLIFDAKFDPVLYDQEQWFDHVHNIFFDMLIAGGLFGFIAYVLIFVFAIRMLWKDERMHFTEKVILIGLFVAYIVQNFFAFDNIVSYMYFIFILAFINSSGKKDFDLPVLENSKQNQTVAFSVAVIVAVLLVYSVNAKAFAANVTTIAGIRWVVEDGRGGHTVEQKDAGLANMKKAFGYDSFASGEIAQQIMNGARVASTFQEIDPIVRAEYIQFAKMVAEDHIAEDPKNSRYYYLYGSFLANVGQLEEAEIYLKKAIELSPTKPSTRDLLPQVLLALSKNEEAVHYAKETYELQPAYDNAWITYLVTLNASGDLKTYNDFVQEAVGAGRLDRIEKLYSKFIAVNSDNPAWYRLLASLFIEEGRYADAKAVLSKGVENIPASKPDFDLLLKEIESRESLNK